MALFRVLKNRGYLMLGSDSSCGGQRLELSCWAPSPIY